jgi:hypothetical protein
MNAINVKATSSTPAVLFGENRTLSIKGRSIPANEAKFYGPIIDWAEKLVLDKLIIEINLEYMNSGSSKMILYLLKRLDSNSNLNKLSVKWYYEAGDEAMYECGRIFKETLKKAEFRFYRYRDAS